MISQGLFWVIPFNVIFDEFFRVLLEILIIGAYSSKSHEFSHNHISFLDTTVKINERRELYTTLYEKPTDTHLYLHYSIPKVKLKKVMACQT